MLGGTGTLNVSGLFTWTGGGMDDSGTTNANGGMVLSSNNHDLNNSRILNIAAGTTATWTGGDIRGGNDATINVNGIFDIQTDADFGGGFGGSTALNVNSGGTLRKTVATGVTRTGAHTSAVQSRSQLVCRRGPDSLNSGSSASGSSGSYTAASGA